MAILDTTSWPNLSRAHVIGTSLLDGFIMGGRPSTTRSLSEAADLHQPVIAFLTVLIDDGPTTTSSEKFTC